MAASRVGRGQYLRTPRSDFNYAFRIGIPIIFKGRKNHQNRKILTVFFAHFFGPGQKLRKHAKNIFYRKNSLLVSSTLKMHEDSESEIRFAIAPLLLKPLTVAKTAVAYRQNH